MWIKMKEILFGKYKDRDDKESITHVACCMYIDAWGAGENDCFTFFKTRKNQTTLAS